MDYAGLPIFPAAIDWGDPVNGTWEYDLREIQIGFGPELLDPQQAHVVHGWEFGVEVRGADITTLNTFLDGRRGRAFPFWLPGPAIAARIVAGVSTSAFNITEQGLTDSWDEHPAKYLYFTKTGQTPQVGVISAVSDLGGGLERVTLSPALSTAVDQTWTVQPLYLVRQGDDVERIQVMAEGWQRRTFRVVELPNDYGAVREVKQPIYLYRFLFSNLGVEIEWFFTSYPTSQTVSGEDWVAAGIEHKSISQSVMGDGRADIEGDYDNIEPLRLMVPNLLMGPLLLEILETNTDLDAPVSLFTGYVVKPSLDGHRRRIKATCEQFGGALGQDIPGFFIQRECNYRVYQPDTCRVNPATFQKTATISSLTDRTLVVAGAGLAGLAANWFALGWIEVGSGSNKEIRFVLESTAASGTSITLTLNGALRHAAVSDTVTLLPGDDGRRSTCIAKFNNVVNFGGHETPQENLTLQAIPTTPAGGKK
jgi:uncharacterized phage protein (TIGR02218 family)